MNQFDDKLGYLCFSWQCGSTSDDDQPRNLCVSSGQSKIARLVRWRVHVGALSIGTGWKLSRFEFNSCRLAAILQADCFRWPLARSDDGSAQGESLLRSSGQKIVCYAVIGSMLIKVLCLQGCNSRQSRCYPASLGQAPRPCLILDSIK